VPPPPEWFTAQDEATQLRVREAFVNGGAVNLLATFEFPSPEIGQAVATWLEQNEKQPEVYEAIQGHLLRCGLIDDDRNFETPEAIQCDHELLKTNKRWLKTNKSEFSVLLQLFGGCQLLCYKQKESRHQCDYCYQSGEPCFQHQDLAATCVVPLRRGSLCIISRECFANACKKHLLSFEQDSPCTSVCFRKA